jgi:hypothetical protein
LNNSDLRPLASARENPLFFAYLQLRFEHAVEFWTRQVHHALGDPTNLRWLDYYTRLSTFDFSALRWYQRNSVCLVYPLTEDEDAPYLDFWTPSLQNLHTNIQDLAQAKAARAIIQRRALNYPQLNQAEIANNLMAAIYVFLSEEMWTTFGPILTGPSEREENFQVIFSALENPPEYFDAHPVNGIFRLQLMVGFSKRKQFALIDRALELFNQETFNQWVEAQIAQVAGFLEGFYRIFYRFNFVPG